MGENKIKIILNFVSSRHYVTQENVIFFCYNELNNCSLNLK